MNSRCIFIFQALVKGLQHIYIQYVVIDLHDSLQHFLWVGVKQSINIMATSGSDFLNEDRYNRD